MTAFTAGLLRGDDDVLVGTSPRISGPSRPPPASIASTASTVGGMTGKPSVYPTGF